MAKDEWWGAEATYDVDAIFGAATHKGLVKFTIGDVSKVISPQEARDFATSIIAAAEAAEMDEIVMRWLMVGGTKAEVAVLQLRVFRQIRDLVAKERARDSST